MAGEPPFSAIPANQYGFNGEANDFHAAAPYTTGQFELSSIVLNGNPSNNVYVFGRGTQYSGTINTATQDVDPPGHICGLQNYR